jgi:hypothetical protein
MQMGVRLIAGLAWGAVAATAGCASGVSPLERSMHAQLSTDGGVAIFPGLSQPIQLEDQNLSPDERSEFSRLVAAARDEAASNSAVTPMPGAVKPVPDGRTYRIDVDGGEHLQLSAADPAPPHFAALLEFIKQHGRR